MATITISNYKMYANAMNAFMTKAVDLVNDTIKVALITSAKAPAQSDTGWTAAAYTQVTGTLAGSPAYANGYTLASKAVTTSVNTTSFTAGNLSVSGVTTTASIAHLVVYDDTATNKPLLAFYTLTTPTDCDGTLTINWNAAGLFQLTV